MGGWSPTWDGAIDAVILDLFGTLVPNFDLDRFCGCVDGIADVLGAPREGFRAEWRATFRQEHVLAGLGVAGEACVYVGDGNSEELPGAKRHGMTTVWVDNGEAQGWKDRFVPEADVTIHDLCELPAIVAGR